VSFATNMNDISKSFRTKYIKKIVNLYACPLARLSTWLRFAGSHVPGAGYVTAKRHALFTCSKQRNPKQGQHP